MKKYAVMSIMFVAVVMLMAAEANAKHANPAEFGDVVLEEPCVLEGIDIGIPSGVTARFECPEPVDVNGPLDMTGFDVGIPSGVTVHMEAPEPIDVIGPCDVTGADVGFPSGVTVRTDCSN